MTENKYKFYNNIIGWAVLIIALVTYTLTLEPSTSFWDSGEFISSAFKLEVGHPPGAPLFMLIARFFSMFSTNLETVALSINMVSAVAGAFTILFLFWTITYFSEKILIKNNDYSFPKVFTILSSGLVGSLAYTFSDTFWFSAVEAEVYSLSSLFTAVVFWVILKWERVADQKYANRWLVLIAFIMGLSIGVHLLNLLAIPAIVFVYYFKKYEVSRKGIIYTFLISMALLLTVLYGIIQGYFVIASKFELLFVNSFGFSYNSGLYFFLLLTIIALIAAIYYTHKYKKYILNLAVLFLAVILIGYSSYAVIFIRSAANPPMDENNPENIFALLSYLNREQYGSRPLVWGPYYDAEFKTDDVGNMVTEPRHTYIAQDDKYIEINKSNPKYFYKSEDMTLFPRMYSRAAHHKTSYKIWGSIDNTPETKPNFANNILFFAKYQIGQMYFRYLMWNFAGRQNNEQGQSIINGNWLSGIPFIDSIFLSSQSNLPDSIKNHESRNTYFLIPLILGIIGIMFSFKKDNKNASIIMLLFFFTGIAIVLYLNQTPQQPRERDYAYAGSFYAFSIWIGLSVGAIFEKLKKFFSSKYASYTALAIGLSTPILMGWQNWDDHNRSGRYTARDFAKNYLDSCEKNAIIFTYGDNDTFPLWYVQEVEGYRTDIKVVNLSLLGTNWYIDQARRQTYDAAPIPFKMDKKLYVEGSRDAIYAMENPQFFIDEKFKASPEIFLKEYGFLKETFFEILENSKFPENKPSDYKLILNSKENLTPLKFASLLNGIYSKKFIEGNNISKVNIDSLATKSKKFFERISKSHLPLQNAMDFVASEDDDTQIRPNTEDELNYIPSKRLCLAVDSANVVNSGVFSKKEKALFKKKIQWTINKNYFYKNEMAALEIIARNNWKRPVYFASSVGSDNYLGLENYFRLEGFAYRLVPFENTSTDVASMNTDILYENLMNKFSWGRMNEDDVLIDNFNRRVIRIMDIRGTFLLLAKNLYTKSKIQKTISVLDKIIEILPESKLPFKYTALEIADLYYELGENTKADNILQVILNREKQEFEYYNSLKGNSRIYFSQERKESESLIGIINKLSVKYDRGIIPN